MHISSVIKISFCRISFSGHQNKFCACLDSIYGSRVILVMCKNCSDIRWHRLNSNQSKTNCPKNLNSDGLIVGEMGPWPECIFRSLLQFLVYIRAAGCPECICNRPRPWRRPCVSTGPLSDLRGMAAGSGTSLAMRLWLRLRGSDFTKPGWIWPREK